MRIAFVVSLLSLTLASCSHAAERTLLTQFFAACRLRDLTAARNFSTVVFEPATDGIVTSFEVTGVAAVTGTGVEEVSIAAPVRLPDGRIVLKHFAVRIQQGLITAITERPASPSLPRS